MQLEAPPLPAPPEKFDEKYMRHAFVAPTRPLSLYSWPLDAIASARDDHVIGRFARSRALRRSMKKDAAIASALLQRVAPPRGLPSVIEATIATEQTEAIRAEAEATFGAHSTAIPLALVTDLDESQAFDGLAIGQVRWMPRADGSRWDLRLTEWPLEAVYLDPIRNQLQAQTLDSGLVDIVHGDGKWVVIAQHEAEPWTWGALVPLALLWADRSYALRDRANNAEAHGIAKLVGYLPKEIPLDSDQGQAFVAFVQGLSTAKSGGVAPTGAEVKVVESMSQAWQIYREIMQSDLGDANRVLLGQDATAQNAGGNYMKAAFMWGVRNDVIEADFAALDGGLAGGVLRPWSLINFGVDVGLRKRWLMPDPDEDTRRESLATRSKAFAETLQVYRKSGLTVTQELADKLAKQYGVEAAQLVAGARGEIFQYDIELGTVTINEVRDYKGLPPRAGGDKTVPERDAELAATATAPAPAASAPPSSAPAEQSAA